MFKLFRTSDRTPPPRSAPPGPSLQATEADLAACFRLLLGRVPQPDEWRAHTGKIGRDLRSMVASFTGSPEFARSGLLPPPPAAADAMANPEDLQNQSRMTTADDIYYCFRLILGRQANREEWVGHSSQIGQDLVTVVAGYTQSLEFVKREMTRKSHQSPISLIRHNGFQIYVADDDAAVGQHVAGGSYEPEVAAVFHRVLRPGMSVIDIGANIGYFTMLSAGLVGTSGRVLAIEPNPRNVRLLEASRRANAFENVTILQSAAGRETGVLVLNTTHSNGTTSTASGDLDRLMASETVGCIQVDSLVAPTSRVDFIKVDVEGAEYNALLGCSRILAEHRPIIVTEFSPDMMSSTSMITGPDYLRWLVRCGYAVSIIAKDGAPDVATDTIEQVMAAYEASGTDHIDLIATPR